MLLFLTGLFLGFFISFLIEVLSEEDEKTYFSIFLGILSSIYFFLWALFFTIKGMEKYFFG